MTPIRLTRTNRQIDPLSTSSAACSVRIPIRTPVQLPLLPTPGRPLTFWNLHLTRHRNNTRLLLRVWRVPRSEERLVCVRNIDGGPEVGEGFVGVFHDLVAV